MPKLKTPLLSLGAKGGIGKIFSMVRRGRQNIIERKPILIDAKSPAQLFNRHMFNKCVDLWHLLSEAERQEWESLARSRHMSGYAWYISQCLRPNPGIYLPLQGGTMAGDIDMGKNRILKLPAPIDDQEAAPKGYVDALTKVVWKDASEQAMIDGNRLATLDWTDLDLTAFTSATAKIAYLELQLRADTVGNGSFVYLSVRKNGTTPTFTPILIQGTEIKAMVSYRRDILVGLDSGQVIEYRIASGDWTGWQIDTNIQVFGYIE